MRISEDSEIRLYLLNGEKLIVEVVISIPQLKKIYPKQWTTSQQTLEPFICLCLEKWAENYDNWNVGTFDIIN